MVDATVAAHNLPQSEECFLSLWSLSPPLAPLVLFQTWLPGMQAAASAGLASALSTRMGKVNQKTGTPTPTPPFSPGTNSVARFSVWTPALSGKQLCFYLVFPCCSVSD